MFKQIALAATLFATTTIVAPEAKAMTAAQAVDRQQELSTAAYNRDDIAKFCVHEANLLFIEREAPGTLTNSFKTQTQNNISVCRERGYSTKASMQVESNTTAPQVTLPDNYCAGGSFGISAPALCTGNGYNAEQSKATQVCRNQGYNGVRPAGNGWVCMGHRSNGSNGSFFTL